MAVSKGSLNGVLDTLVRETKGVGREPFVMIPNLLIRCPSITPTAKALYALLLSYAGSGELAFPGQDRLVVELGVSRNTIRKALAELESAGVLESTRRGRCATNLYKLKPWTGAPEAPACEDVRSSNSELQDTKYCASGSSDSEQVMLNNCTSGCAKSEHPSLYRYSIHRYSVVDTDNQDSAVEIHGGDKEGDVVVYKTAKERVQEKLAQADTDEDRKHWRSEIYSRMRGKQITDKAAYALGILTRWEAGDGAPPKPVPAYLVGVSQKEAERLMAIHAETRKMVEYNTQMEEEAARQGLEWCPFRGKMVRPGT